MKKSELKRRLDRVEIDRIRWMDRWVEECTLSRDREEEILLLVQECHTLATWLISEWVTVHESKVADVDLILSKYLGTSNDQ